MNLSLPRVKRLLPDHEYQIVADVVGARELPDSEVTRLTTLVRRWRDKYVDRAHRQAREARGKGKPRSTRGSESNENTMRQADIMDWVLERLGELGPSGAKAAATAGSKASSDDAKGGSGPKARSSLPTKADVRKAIGEPHVSSFGDLWAEFPEAPVWKLRKLLWSLVEAGEVELSTAGGIELTAEEQVAFVEEVQTIDGVPVKQRAGSGGIPRKHQEHLARTKVVRIRSHNRARGGRNQAKRDRRSGGRR